MIGNIFINILFQVSLRVIEAKDLAGVSLDPWVNIEIAGTKKNTTLKKQTNNPTWDEVNLKLLHTYHLS